MNIFKRMGWKHIGDAIDAQIERENAVTSVDTSLTPEQQKAEFERLMLAEGMIPPPDRKLSKSPAPDWEALGNELAAAVAFAIEDVPHRHTMMTCGRCLLDRKLGDFVAALQAAKQVKP